jgi:hypothetical protein
MSGSANRARRAMFENNNRLLVRTSDKVIKSFPISERVEMIFH